MKKKLGCMVMVGGLMFLATTGAWGQALRTKPSVLSRPVSSRSLQQQVLAKPTIVFLRDGMHENVYRARLGSTKTIWAHSGENGIRFSANNYLIRGNDIEPQGAGKIEQGADIHNGIVITNSNDEIVGVFGDVDVHDSYMHAAQTRFQDRPGYAPPGAGGGGGFGMTPIECFGGASASGERRAKAQADRCTNNPGGCNRAALEKAVQDWANESGEPVSVSVPGGTVRKEPQK